ncbi:hypothetical protein ACRWHE_24045, partial [Escherichia coli]
LNQPGAIPGAVLHHLPSVPVSVLRDLTQLPDSVLQNPPPIPAWRSPLRKQNKSTIIRLRSFVCIADDAPEKRVNMSSPEYYNQPSSDGDQSYALPVARLKNASI